jgi:hypothetical protein
MAADKAHVQELVAAGKEADQEVKLLHTVIEAYKINTGNYVCDNISLIGEQNILCNC